jgi:shikimate kinase
VKKNLILLGMMGVGKTTLGKLVAKNQDLEFIDTDANIEDKNSMTINEIFEQKGENFFRLEEKKEILNSLSKQDCVIALGGGAFMNKTIRESVLKNAISVWLDIDLKILNQRLKWNQKRPLLKKYNNQKKLNELYELRKNIYQLANHKIVCDKLNKEDIVNRIIRLYEKY